MLDTLWVVIAATLVFLMQPGFMCLESGLTRSKNSINVAVKNLADFVFSILLFWLAGYGLMFGGSAAGLLGTSSFMAEFGSGHGSATFFYFQAMFCGTATTIFSGAVAERMKFSSYLLMVIPLSVLIYPLFGHWAWNGLDTGTPQGWLGQVGFVDFAGSTVVHSVGGWFALATLTVIGPRRHRFAADSPVFGFNGSNLPLSVLGTFLLWIGWIGFNGGSTLAMDATVSRIIVHTILAGAAGAFANLLIGCLAARTPRVTFLINGSLGGLVAITAGCHCVSGAAAVLIGLVAGVVSFGAELLLIRLRIDDAVGAIPVHLACGIWGTLAVALLGDPELIGTGLGMGAQLAAQLKGIVSAFLLAFVLPLPLIKTIDRLHPLRVSAEEEHNGLNFSEHGATTELVELCQAMDRQAQARDLTLRMPVEPFTEVGLIAARHNQIMDALESALSHTEAVVTLAKDAIITFAEESLSISNINPSGRTMFGLDAEGAALSHIRLTDLFDPADYSSQRLPLWRGETVETIGRRRCGARFPMQAVITRAGRNGSSFWIGTFMDLSELRMAQGSLERQRAYYHQLFEATSQAILALDSDRKIVSVNRGFERLFGYPANELLGRQAAEFIVPEDRLEEIEITARAVFSGEMVRRETVRRHRDGRLIPVSLLAFPIQIQGRLEGIFFIYEDISDRKAFEDQLFRQAFHDNLTGIANRALFMERMNRALERRKRHRQFNFAVLLIDLDRFKWVNDSLGHLAGDSLLGGIADRFLSCVRSGDTVARLGGDEFAVMIEDYDKPARVIEIANRLQDETRRPFSVAGTEIRISASIGIVLNTGCYRSTQDILRDADIAMYRAKELGKARFQVFNRRLHRLVSETLQLENELREAIASGSLCLHYQPILSIGSRKLIGFETLVRWNHPERGLIYPDRFIPIAEETGLIIPLGEWVMAEACRQMAQWRRTVPGAAQLKVNVNISPKQFLQKDLVATVIAILERTGFSPQQLKIEITESAIMEGGRQTIEQMNRLKGAGITLAIDDFGTGYSSLSALQRFPLDDIKIDRSFIRELEHRSEDREIVKTIISLARTLGLNLVAEGVENEEQFAILDALGCDMAQGYLFSPPVAAGEVPAIVTGLLKN